MAAGLKVSLVGSMSVEWTVGRPKNNSFLNGPDFTVDGIRCFLQFFYKYASEYDLFLHVCGELTSSVHATASLSQGTDLFLSRTQDGIEKERFYLIWRSNESEVSKVVPDFQQQGMWCFKVDIRKFPTEDKCVQTPEYADANFEIQSLSRDLSKLLVEDTKNVDVELECEGITFKAHRSLLSARSEVFRAMLRSDMTEGNSGQVLIKDVEADLFRKFLRYLYTGKLDDLNLDTAMRLYEVADKYHVEPLKRQCTSFLADSLKQDNVCSILSLAERHSDAQLKEDAIAYILDRKIPLRDDEPNHDWSQFTVSHPTLAVEVLTRLCKLQESR